MFRKKRVLKVENNKISVKKFDGEDYISITDMTRNKDGDFFVADWLRNRNTVEFLGIWESMNNPNFNYGEFAIIKSKVGLNNYKLSVKEWAEKTNAIGLRALLLVDMVGLMHKKISHLNLVCGLAQRLSCI